MHLNGPSQEFCQRLPGLAVAAGLAAAAGGDGHRRAPPKAARPAALLLRRRRASDPAATSSQATWGGVRSSDRSSDVIAYDILLFD